MGARFNCRLPMTPGPTLVVSCPSCSAQHLQATLGSGNTLGAVWWSDGKCDAPMLPELPVVTRCTACARLFWVHEAKSVGELPRGLFFRDVHSRKLILTSLGQRRVDALRVLRERLSLSLADVLEFAATTPRTIAYGEPNEELLSLKKAIEDAGGETTLIDSSGEGRSGKAVLPSGWDAAPLLPLLVEGDYLDAVAEGLGCTRDQALFLRTRAWWASNDGFRSGTPDWVSPDHRAARARENCDRLFELLSINDPDECLMKGELARERGDFGASVALVQRIPTTPSEVLRRLVEGIERRANEGDTSLFSVEDRPEFHHLPKTSPAPKRWKEFQPPLHCVHCGEAAVKYRELPGGQLVCPSCGRSLDKPSSS